MQYDVYLIGDTHVIHQTSERHILETDRDCCREKYYIVISPAEFKFSFPKGTTPGLANPSERGLAWGCNS